MVAIFKMKEVHPLVLLGQPRRGAKAGENGGEKDQKAQPPHTSQVRFLSGIYNFQFASLPQHSTCVLFLLRQKITDFWAPLIPPIRVERWRAVPVLRDPDGLTALY